MKIRDAVTDLREFIVRTVGSTTNEDLAAHEALDAIIVGLVSAGAYDQDVELLSLPESPSTSVSPASAGS